MSAFPILTRCTLTEHIQEYLETKSSAFKILENFRDSDLRGISAVRNYIAHDYDSVDDNIIEDVIRYDLPNIKEQAKKLL